MCKSSLFFRHYLGKMNIFNSTAIQTTSVAGKIAQNMHAFSLAKYVHASSGTQMHFITFYEAVFTLFHVNFLLFPVSGTFILQQFLAIFSTLRQSFIIPYTVVYNPHFFSLSFQFEEGVRVIYPNKCPPKFFSRFF